MSDMTESGFPGSVGNALATALEKVLDGGGEVFSEPHQVGDITVITAATWERGGGFGFGGGSGDGGNGSGGGGGGGGGASGRPVAVIEVGSAGVFIRPVYDFTKLGVTLLAGLFAVWRAGRSG